jgi:DUF971 family protein
MQAAEIEIGDGGGTLRITWANGQVCGVSAELLWSACPSARARRRRLDGRSDQCPRGLIVKRAEPVGHYGLNIAFSDGDDRGVFPWSMLASLAARPKAEDFIIPAEAGAA